MQTRQENCIVTKDKIEEILINAWEKIFRVQNIGINDNYFELGGDFYKAVQITAYLKKFKLQLNVDALFTNPQISRLVDFVEPCEEESYLEGCEIPCSYQHLGIPSARLTELKKYINSIAGDKAKIKDIYPLTPVQERMFMHYLFFKQSKANYLQYAFIIHGNFDYQLFEESLNMIMQRHDIFRTIFTARRLMKPLQVVLKVRRTKVNYKDISALSKEDKEIYIRNVKKSDGEKGFDLAKDILTRMSILKTSECTYEVIWSFHHILLDGWSIEIVCNEIFMAYKALKSNEALKLWDVQPIAKYISWLEEQDSEKANEFWKKYLDNYKQDSTLGKFGNKVNEGQYNRKELIFSLGLSLSEDIRKFARYNKVIIDIVFEAIWGIILQMYNKTDDVVFLTVVSGRPAEVSGIDKMVSFFSNMNPVRIKCNGDTEFSDLVRCVNSKLIDAKKYEYCSIKQIIENTQTPINLTDNVVIFESYPLDEEVLNLSKNEYYEFYIKRKEVYQQTGFDFNFVIIPGDEYKVALNYNEMIYSEDFIQGIKNNIYNIVNSVNSNYNISVNDIKKTMNDNNTQKI